MLTIGGVKIPALMSFLFFATAFILSKKKDFEIIFKNKVFVFGLLYFGIIFINYAFVMHDLLFKAYDELTPLWISIFRRLVTSLFIFFSFRDERQAIKLFYFYCGGLVLSSLAAYPEMFILKHHIFDPNVSEGNEGYQRAIGFFTNPNDFALTTVVAIIFMYHKYLISKKKIFLIITILLIPPVFLSFSRNGLACLFLASYLAFNIGKKIRWQTILYLFISFVSLCLIILFVPSIKERVFLLFSGEDTSAVGRYLVIFAAYQKWLTMPVWGIGVLSSPLLLEDMGNEGLLITIHNFYAHALFESGIIGFVIVILFLFTLYKAYSKIFQMEPADSASKYFARAALITLIVMYFYIFSGNHIIFEFLWYMVGVLFVIMRSRYKKKIIQESQTHE